MQTNRFFSDFVLAYNAMKALAKEHKCTTYLHRTTYGQNHTPEYSVRFEHEVIDKSNECILDWYPHTPHQFEDKLPEPGRRIQLISPPEQGVKPFEVTYQPDMYYIDGSAWLYV